MVISTSTMVSSILSPTPGSDPSSDCPTHQNSSLPTLQLIRPPTQLSRLRRTLHHRRLTNQLNRLLTRHHSKLIKHHRPPISSLHSLLTLSHRLLVTRHLPTRLNRSPSTSRQRRSTRRRYTPTRRHSRLMKHQHLCTKITKSTTKHNLSSIVNHNILSLADKLDLFYTHMK